MITFSVGSTKSGNSAFERLSIKDQTTLIENSEPSDRSNYRQIDPASLYYLVETRSIDLDAFRYILECLAFKYV